MNLCIHILLKSAACFVIQIIVFSAGLPSKTLWRNFESIGLHDRDRSFVTHQSPDRLNSFFTSSSGSHCPPFSTFMENTRPNPGNGFLFTLSEVLNSILRIGLDEIPLKFLKLFFHYVLPFLTHIFRTTITPGTFPVAWKISK
jgi:hypothetical protein